MQWWWATRPDSARSWAGKLIDSTGVTDIEADRVFNELKGQLTAKYGKPSASEKSTGAMAQDQ